MTRAAIKDERSELVERAIRTTAKQRGVTMPKDKVIQEIAAERQRQIEAEGWTPDHDDQHSDWALARAAACYATGSLNLEATSGDERGWRLRRIWPWSREWWKPSDRRRDLIKAGALIVAEIERLDRSDHAQIRSLGAEPAIIAPDAPHYAPDNHDFELWRKDAPVAWSFELARAMTWENGRPTGVYCDWGPPQVSFSKPCVPEGSIRNLTPLYAGAPR